MSKLFPTVLVVVASLTTLSALDTYLFSHDWKDFRSLVLGYCLGAGILALALDWMGQIKRTSL